MGSMPEDNRSPRPVNGGWGRASSVGGMLGSFGGTVCVVVSVEEVAVVDGEEEVAVVDEEQEVAKGEIMLAGV